MNVAQAGAALALLLAVLPAAAQNVKITPVGSHPGELCANDRATIFNTEMKTVVKGLSQGEPGGAQPWPERRYCDVHLAISGRTMEFDGKGKCVAGC